MTQTAGIIPVGCHIEATKAVYNRGNRQGWNVDSSVETSLKFIDKKNAAATGHRIRIFLVITPSILLWLQRGIFITQTSLMSNISPPHNKEAKHMTDQSHV
jgi:hypothetical protein